MKILMKYRYIITMITMAFFGLFIKSFLNGNPQVAFFWLLAGCILFSSKLIFLLSAGKFEELTEQFMQWLFEFGIVLTVSGFNSAAVSPVFGAIMLALGVLCFLGFALMVLKNHFR
jgi:hypothetical protein